MKRRTLWALVAGVALVLSAVALAAVVRPAWLRGVGASVRTVYYCPMHPSYTSDRPGNCPICNMQLVKRDPGDPTQTATAASGKSICYLHNCPKLHNGQPCPMTVVAKKGEKVICPICGEHIAEAAETHPAHTILYWTDPMIPGYKASGPGKSPMGMDLVPVYAEEAAASASAASAPEGYAPVLLTPEKQQLSGVRTAPVERRHMTKTIRTVGWIAYDPQLYQAEEEYLQALHAAQRAEQGTIPEIKDQSKRLVESSRIRLRLLGLSDALIEEMATWSGPDQSLLLTDPNKHVWLYATIYEYELPFVSVGQTVQVELPARPGTTFEGTIRSIDPVIDPQSRSARVRAVLTDPDGVLKPQMYVNAMIKVDAGDVLAVPQEAVFSTGTRTVLFVAKGQGLFEPRDVVLGVKADDYVEVKRGVAAGEVVVTSGNFLIDSESRLKAASQGTASSGDAHGR